jgi:hypothetical protein
MTPLQQPSHSRLLRASDTCGGKRAVGFAPKVRFAAALTSAITLPWRSAAAARLERVMVDEKRIVGREAKDLATSVGDAGEQGDCGNDSDADAQ